MSDEIRHMANNKATRLDNLTCVYCGYAETQENSLTDDHVVGRRFVPKGSFAKGWSLIVRACARCNNEKADLEDDISAITLHPHRSGDDQDPGVAEYAGRKARGSFSRLTRKLVQDSNVEDTIKGRLMDVAEIRFSVVGPPQIDPARVHALACMHLQAFFYFISYDAERRQGGFIPGDFGIVGEASRSDWGNVRMRAFAAMTKGWDTRVVGGGAQGYFRIAIRRAPVATPLWSFALEWNASLRTVGFFGDLIAAQPYVDGLPQLEWRRIDATRRMREEIALDPALDELFESPEDVRT